MLVRFERPMTEDEAIKRERELATELREENYTVHGGQKINVSLCVTKFVT